MPEPRSHPPQAADECLSAVRAKRLIFTATPGRSGTGYLARVLGRIAGVGAYHEAAPAFDAGMRRALDDPRSARSFWVERKLPAIAADPHPIYAETSHLFCKGFAEPLLDLGLVPDLIVLTRPHRQVAASLYALGTVPGRSPAARAHYLTPEDPGVLPIADWQTLDDYQLCFWYCLEIERRQRLLAERVAVAGGRVVAISLAELRRLAGFRRLTRELSLPEPGLGASLRLLLGSRRRVNAKRAAKRPGPAADGLDELEREVRARLARVA